MNKFFKSLLIMFLLTACFFTGAFRWGNVGDKGVQLYFSIQPIQKNNINNVGRVFRAGDRVYYLLTSPRDFRDEYLRIQIIKKEQKTNQWGYKLYRSKDVHIERGQREFMSYFVINEPGYYFVQIFSFDDFDRVVARNDFWIK